MRDFFKELDEIESRVSGDENYVFDRQFIEKKAKENNYKGHIEERDSASDGKTYVIYVTGRSGLETIANAAAHKRNNPLN